MITTNITKKTLVEKLLESKSITIEDAYMLLDEPVSESTREFVPYPYVIPQPYNYPQPWGIFSPIDWPYQTFCSGTISCDSNTIEVSTFEPTTIAIYNCPEHAGSSHTMN